MLNKVFKTILILSICLGLTLPTNAAVSVSDGSAFVTKSEFNSDLNNLSNRMAQLENSLDGKIDSLVSSYITRNGIWNGERQLLEFNAIADYWDNFTLSGLNYNWKSKPSMPSTLTEGQIATIRSGSYDLIKTVTKTGMLFGTLDVLTGYDYAKASVPTASGTDGRNYFYVCNFNRKYNNPNVTNSCESSFWINDVCVYSFVPIKCEYIRTMQRDGFAAASLYFVPKPGRYNFMFFVSKGDKIVMDYRFAIIPQTNDARNNWQGCDTYVVGSYPGVVVLLNELSVY